MVGYSCGRARRAKKKTITKSPGLLVGVGAGRSRARRCRKELIAKLPPGGVNGRTSAGKALPRRKPATMFKEPRMVRMRRA